MRGSYPVSVSNPPRPRLRLIKEGNPGHRTKEQLRLGLQLPPGAPPEPDWTARFGPVRGNAELTAQARRCRERARREWRLVVPVLDAMGMLSVVDAAVLEDWATCVARLDQCEREVTRRGLVVKGERGWQRNGATIIAAAYRHRLGHLSAQLGLDPLARDRLRGDPRGASADSDPDSPFDV
jgi:P27 family predicted phage terminase small subunit